MKIILLFLSVFLSATLFGQIIYNNLEPDIFIDTSSEDFLIDFNEDGLDELSFLMGDPGLGFPSIVTAINPLEQTEVVGLDTSLSGLVSFLLIEKLSAGQLVNELSSFINDSITYDYNYPVIRAVNDISDFGFFQEGLNGFVGVKFYISGAQHFGWIRIESNNEGETLIIKDYAYQQTPGIGIIIGDDGTGTTSLTELTTTKNLIQTLDLMGRETSFKPNTPLIYVYDDGSIEKVFSVEY